MAWIKTIEYEAATGILKKLYDRVKGANNYIDNILKVHSLRPHSLKGHMAIYKNVLHHRNNTFPKWFLETLGVYVSILNGCEYCYRHHFSGLERLIKDEAKAKKIWNVLEAQQPELFFSGKELALLNYAQKLTMQPQNMSENDFSTLQKEGLTDGEILEANQVISYFSYANRTVLGLGVSTEGDILGLSPNDNDLEENWGHQ